MGEFGKRSTRTGRSAPHAKEQGLRHGGEPELADLISARDLKYIESGRLPVWASMTRKQLFALCVFVPVLMLLAVGYYGPDVVRDHRLAGTFNLALDLRATDGECRRHALTITLCSAKIRSAQTGEVVHDSSFMMFFRSGDGALMLPVRSSVDPSAISIEYAVSEVLMNRTLSLLAGLAFFAWISWLFVGCLRDGRYQGGQAHQAALQYLALRSQPA